MLRENNWRNLLTFHLFTPHECQRIKWDKFFFQNSPKCQSWSFLIADRYWQNRTDNYIMWNDRRRTDKIRPGCFSIMLSYVWLDSLKRNYFRRLLQHWHNNLIVGNNNGYFFVTPSYVLPPVIPHQQNQWQL